MGDLDFDVRISTNHLDAAALMSDIGTALAHGTFRVPARLSTERALELVVVARSGAVAMKGKVEVLGYEGEHTWLRFLSASDHASAEAHLVLSEVTLELAPRQTAPLPIARTSAPTRPAPPARGTRPAPPRVVAVPPRARPTSSHAAVAEPPLAGERSPDPSAAPSQPASPSAAAPPRRSGTGSESVIEARAPTRATGALSAVRVPPRLPPRARLDADAPTSPEATPAVTTPTSEAAPLPATVTAPASVVTLASVAAAPAGASPEEPVGAALSSSPPQPRTMAAADASIASARAGSDQLAAPLPPPPVAEPLAPPQIPLESVVPWWTAPSAPAPALRPAPIAPEALAAPPSRGDPLRQSDLVARFGTAPLETSQDAARAYVPDAALLPPVAPPAPRAPLSRREKRVLGAAGAIAALGFAVAGAALWSTRGDATARHLTVARCEPAPTVAATSEPAPAAASSAPVSRATDEPSCLLQVTSNASLAEIWIEGERRGKVPAQLEVPCRPTSVALRHPRYLAAQREVVPAPGTTEVALRLTRPLVTVKIESRPPGATVRVNGRAVGKTPLATKVLAFERGTVVLSHDGGAIKTMQIYPQADNTVVSATLPKPRARARSK